ncbi:hypothetical protein [Bradyrhizobium sp. RDM4]|uniref:hypothetical protein n=1 Tax=Bradyrhizobium sp. RDM4 TaxID=3378765 RepID=UPI0038FBEB1F
MRTKRTIAAALRLGLLPALVVTTPGFAAADKKALYSQSYGSPSKLAGLKVVRSGTRPMPAGQLVNWKGQSIPIIVDIDTEGPGGGQRYSYVCAGDRKTGAFVQQISTPDARR